MDKESITQEEYVAITTKLLINTMKGMGSTFTDEVATAALIETHFGMVHNKIVGNVSFSFKVTEDD